jgi:hypothetical protein
MTKLIVKKSEAKRDAAIAKATTVVQAWRVEQNASMKYVMDVLKAHGITRLDNKKGANKIWNNDAKRYEGIAINWNGTARDNIAVKLTLCADVDANDVLSALAANNISAQLVKAGDATQSIAYGANGIIVATC